MKKNIQKITLLFILFVFSAVVTFAGEVQCPIMPTPTPLGFASTSETTPEETMPVIISETDSTNKLPEFIQDVIETLSSLF